MAYPRISGTSDVWLEPTSTASEEQTAQAVRRRAGDKQFDGLNSYIIYDPSCCFQKELGTALAHFGPFWRQVAETKISAGLSVSRVTGPAELIEMASCPRHGRRNQSSRLRHCYLNVRATSIHPMSTSNINFFNNHHSTAINSNNNYSSTDNRSEC